ncbi:hypothetical protein [Saccharospirillum salsuginis]|uniref:PEP-CTERM protein-sorting domain-containing protein n=1 Tax=Saccharospirillum salsuginis TaxID=418750 RepID=A0A918KPZ0_9GAMM|nr:hypothetical protein [Saccharospirillum salsuginis]GGX71409.1 hypothetical protein GCM10007392_43650 [Saccharospirillum salsuginis]
MYMSTIRKSVLALPLLLLSSVFGASVAEAGMLYWNLFNFEEESSVGSVFVTYATADDMLNDANRLSVVSPDGPGSSENNIIGSGSDGDIFWNVFNFEEESSTSAVFATYGTSDDMLNDANRLSVVSPDGPGSSENNIVGSGSDGESYWNVFNFEEESSVSAVFATYGSNDDMLNDANRLSVVSPTGPGSSENNIIGSGSDGSLYWNLFNFEGESSVSAVFATYITLEDMLNDSNRLSVVSPNGPGSSENNIVGTGAFAMNVSFPVSAPNSLVLLLFGLAVMGGVRHTKMKAGSWSRPLG